MTSLGAIPTRTSLRLPDFIGVGPPRTATTWLHEALSGHVGLPKGVKETDFFVYKYSKGLAWYAAHFRHCPPDRPMGEFSANYFVGAQTRERIARDVPHCRIICTFRDPVERAYSHYRKAREGGYRTGSFEECLERPDALEWSRYATHLKAWRERFGTEKVLVLIHDDLRSDPQRFLDQVCDFLGITRIPLASSTAHSRTVNAIPTQPRNPGVAWLARSVRDHLQGHGDYALVNLLKRTGLRSLLFGGGPAFEPIRPKTEARLREIFRPEVEALEEMLGRDLSAWKVLGGADGRPPP